MSSQTRAMPQQKVLSGGDPAWKPSDTASQTSVCAHPIRQTTVSVNIGEGAASLKFRSKWKTRKGKKTYDEQTVGTDRVLRSPASADTAVHFRKAPEELCVSPPRASF